MPLPRLAVLPGFGDLCFLPLRDATVRRTVWMVSSPRQLAPPAVQAFADVLRRLRIDEQMPKNEFGTDAGTDAGTDR